MSTSDDIDSDDQTEDSEDSADSEDSDDSDDVDESDSDDSQDEETVKDCEFIHVESNLPVSVKSSNVMNALNMKCIQIEVANQYDSVGDIRGIFFNLYNGFDASKIGSTTIKIRSWVENGSSASVDRSGSPTVYQCNSGGIFSQLQGDVNMNGDSGGSYMCAVEVRAH